MQRGDDNALFGPLVPPQDENVLHELSEFGASRILGVKCRRS